MKNRFFLVFAFFIAAQFSVSAQTYTTILKGGHLIDPKNNIDRVMDVAIQDGKIAAIAQNIDPKLGKQVIDLTGKYVTPGLIDIHGHVFAGTDPDGQLENGFFSLPADGFTFRVGVTTIVDCGDSGAETFELFKKNVIDKSQTRVLAFLNISRKGMYGDENSLQHSFFDPVLAADVAKHYPDLIVGFKVAHYHKSDWVAVDRTVEAGKIANLPIIVDFGGAVPRLSLEELFLRKMRPGDIFTHTYGQLIKTKETIVHLDTKKLYPHVIEARKRGIIFDVGHGGGSFTFSQAIPATQQGFFPETISTDLHTGSMNSAMKDQLNVMSKFMSMDMTLANVVKASTWSAAKAIRHEELGHLSVGAIADVAVLNVREGKFGFYDVARYKNEGKNLLILVNYQINNTHVWRTIIR